MTILVLIEVPYRKDGKMKYLNFFIVLLFLSSSLTLQTIQHEAAAINIEVPVRVYKGDAFIDSLTIEDFEVYEDGILQKIEAVYLITKTEVQRKEKAAEIEKIPIPEVSRCFVLVFEVINWLPRINDLIDYFFDTVYQPGDYLIVTTPVKSYNLSERALKQMPKDRIGRQLKSLLRKDIIEGNMGYKSLLRDITSFSNYPDEQGGSYLNIRILIESLFRRLRDYKYFDEHKMENVSNFLKNIQGQKHIFLFYQKEEIPVPAEIEELETLEITPFDINKIKQIFADSEITTHFIFLTKELVGTLDIEQMGGLHMSFSDISMDVFSAFYEIAKTTGGETYVSANASLVFKRASSASENYYLLYYTPKDYKADNEFHKIEVKVKTGRFRITHRAGYIAD